MSIYNLVNRILYFSKWLDTFIRTFVDCIISVSLRKQIDKTTCIYPIAGENDLLLDSVLFKKKFGFNGIKLETISTKFFWILKVINVKLDLNSADFVLYSLM